MHWIPHSTIRPADTVSSLAFSDSGLLACTSWDGRLHIGKEDLQLSASCSRPLFALAWSSALWFGGGESRICRADVEQATVVDAVATEGAVLGLAAAESHAVAGTPTTMVLIDARSSATTEFGSGATSVDVLNNYVCSAGEKSRVHDLRNLRVPVHEHAATGQLLQVKWLSAGTYAVADAGSHVAVQLLNSPSDSFVFQSNCVGALPRPIYALAKGEGTTVVTGGGDGHLFVWDYVKRRLRTKVEFPLACTAIAYAPSGHAMAVGLSSDEWSTTAAHFEHPSKARVMISSL